MRTLKEMTILVADDDAPMRTLLALLLKSEGYGQVEQAGDGQQALACLRRPGLTVDLAFLDIDMPGFTGFEVMAMARAAQPACFWVIVSAHSDVGNVRKALGAGAGGFVVKPYTPRKIHDALSKFYKAATQ